MSSNEINAVIDYLCSKLGTAKEMLVPELAKMCFTRYLVNSIFCLVLLVIAAILIHRSLKIHSSKETCWDAKEIMKEWLNENKQELYELIAQKVAMSVMRSAKFRDILREEIGNKNE